MGLLDKLRANLPFASNDEAFYGLVVDELESGGPRKGLWAKAMTQSGFEEKKARALYIQMRVKHLKKNASHIFSLIDQLSQTVAGKNIADTTLRQEEKTLDALGNEHVKVCNHLTLVQRDASELAKSAPRIRFSILLKHAACIAIPAIIITYILSHSSGHLPWIVAGVVGAACGSFIGLIREQMRPESARIRKRLYELRADMDWSEKKTQELSLAMQLKKEQVSSQRSTLNGLEQRRRETEEKIQLLLN